MQREVGKGVPFTIDRGDIKKKVFPHLKNPESSFIVLNANRYDSRKRIDLTIKGFGKFAEGKENVWLYLHHAIANEEEKKEIQRLANENRCADKIMLNLNTTDRKYIIDNTLNELYNACDVGVNTSMGEGWGMVSFEHAATGAAQILPEDPAGRELWQANALYLRTKNRYIPHGSPFAMVEVYPSELGEQLNYLYQNGGTLLKHSQQAYNHLLNDQFLWSNISREWKNILIKK